MAIYSFSELVPKVFSATITFATELAVLDDCDDQVIAAQRHGLFTDAYKDFSKGLRELEQSTLDLTPDLQIAIEAIKTIDNDCRARCISIGEAALFYAQRRRKLDEAAHNGWVAAKNDGVLPPSLTVPDNTASVEKPVQVAPESQTRLNSESESCAELGTASRHLDVIEKLERKTPQLDTESVEWIVARQENKKNLSYQLRRCATTEPLRRAVAKCPIKCSELTATGDAGDVKERHNQRCTTTFQAFRSVE